MSVKKQGILLWGSLALAVVCCLLEATVRAPLSVYAGVLYICMTLAFGLLLSRRDGLTASRLGNPLLVAVLACVLGTVAIRIINIAWGVLLNCVFNADAMIWLVLADWLFGCVLFCAVVFVCAKAVYRKALCFPKGKQLLIFFGCMLLLTGLRVVSYQCIFNGIFSTDGGALVGILQTDRYYKTDTLLLHFLQLATVALWGFALRKSNGVSELKTLADS